MFRYGDKETKDSDERIRCVEHNGNFYFFAYGDEDRANIGDKIFYLLNIRDFMDQNTVATQNILCAAKANTYIFSETGLFFLDHKKFCKQIYTAEAVKKNEELTQLVVIQGLGGADRSRKLSEQDHLRIQKITNIAHPYQGLGDVTKLPETLLYELATKVVNRGPEVFAALAQLKTAEGILSIFTTTPEMAKLYGTYIMLPLSSQRECQGLLSTEPVYAMTQLVAYYILTISQKDPADVVKYFEKLCSTFNDPVIAEKYAAIHQSMSQPVPTV